MNDMPDPDKMVEATRLTRTGRLAEATALLQRMLRGEHRPGHDISAAAGDLAPDERKPATIDAKAETIEETERPLLNAATSPRPRMTNALRDLLRSRRARLAGPDYGPCGSAPRRPRRTSCRTGTKFIAGDLQQPGGKPCLQALHPQPLSGATASFGRHAARLHPVA